MMHETITAMPMSDHDATALARALEGPGMRSIIAARIDQLRMGHSAETDALLPLDYLPRQAKDFLMIATECIRGIDGKQDLPRARKKLSQSAALLLAAIDRLDAAAGEDRS